MKKYLTLMITLILFSSCNAQQKKTNATVVDGNLVGIADRAMLQQAPFNSWFDLFYKDYQVDETIISQLKPHMKDVKIKIFMGTWCGDSKVATPPFYKIMDALQFDEKNIELITVDRKKSTPENDQQGFDIQRVPTIILFRNNKEIGRFVEYPRETMEADFLKIASGQDYKHSYQD
ncbi:MAG TPA: thioredoxin family protein [Flavobacteriaceae bacterium]|nr:thioredoxin family protein [Flavobacteriaceae bacterium]